MNGLIGQVMKSGGMTNMLNRMMSPQFGGPVQTTRFTPAMNPAGNIVNTGRWYVATVYCVCAVR